MGKSSSLKKARKAAKIVVQKKSLPKRNIIMGILVVLIVGLSFFLYPRVNALLVLRWDKHKILSSSRNSLEYAQVVLGEIITLIPEDIISDADNGYSGQDTIKVWMETIIKNKFPRQAGLIDRAKELVLSGEPIELELLPDRHVLPTSLPEEIIRQIEERQRLHIEYINNLQPEIVFVEALHTGQISSKRLIQDLKDTRKVAGGAMTDLEAAKESQKRNKDFWWREFVDKEAPKLFGIEDRDVVAMGTFIILANYEVVRSDRLKNLSSEFQYYWREQIILANIVLALRKEGASKAALVFGEDHLNTFPRLCELWGVKLRIAGR